MSLKIHFITICLDAMPFITWHYPTFRQLRGIDWEWHVVEGVALPEKDTSWVADLKPRISQDGTHSHVASLADLDSRVKHYYRPQWLGKSAMFNHALEQIEDEEFLLWEVDADEIWQGWQIEEVHRLLTARWSPMAAINCARFHCRYFVGPDIVITSKNTYGNHDAYEWHRVWRVKIGARFECHEPPRLVNFKKQPFEERPLAQEQTEKMGLVFDHYAYATPDQVLFKQAYYGSANNQNGKLYKNAYECWRSLQANDKWPVNDLQQWLPWVGPGVTAERIKI